MLPGWLLEAVGNGGPRGMVTTHHRVTGSGNRTRLTDCFGQYVCIAGDYNDSQNSPCGCSEMRLTASYDLMMISCICI